MRSIIQAAKIPVKKNTPVIQKAVTLIDGAWSRFEKIYKEQFHLPSSGVGPVIGFAGNFSGKRLRPLLFFLTQGAQSGLNDSYADVAVMLELLHLVSLIHDDVVDEADARRGRPSVNAVFGNKIAVLAGDYLMSRLLQLGVRCKQPDALPLITEVTRQMTEAELEEAALKQFYDLTLEQYFQRIERKTAVLFGASCRLGAITSGADPKQVKLWHAFGLDFGMAFQIRDDILDVNGTASILGKPVNQDVHAGIAGLPALLTLRELKGEDRKKFISQFRNKEMPLIKKTIHANNGVERARMIAMGYAESCSLYLRTIPDSPFQKQLFKLIEWNTERES